MKHWGRAVAVAFVVVALAACGGGSKKSSATATGSGSNGAEVSAGSGASGANESAAGDSQNGDDSAVVGGDNGGGDPGGAQPSGSTDAPVPSGLKPFAGNYQFHTTGHATLNGSGQNIDTQGPSTVEDVNDTDQRTTVAGPQGQQIQVLRYSADKVELVSLELKGAVSKTFNGPVLFAPVPSSVGQSWNWSMQSTDTDPTKKTTLTQSSRVDRTETLVIGGQSVDVFVVETDLSFSSAATDLNGTGHLTSWVSPVYKMEVKLHATLSGTYTTAFTFDSDTTSDLLDLRPS